MPVYDYKCDQHGLFHELETMERAAMPAPCPVCQKLSRRVIAIPSKVVQMAPERLKAMERNEKAAHEPRILTPDSAHEHHNKGQCGCHGKSGHRHDTHDSLKQQVIYTANGEKMFPSQRPWMISH